jgi:guanine deaminase
VNQSIELYEKWNGTDNLLYYAFSPRFAPATSEKLLKLVGKFCQNHPAYIHTHLAETKEELKLTKKLFPEYKYYTELYYKTGILSPQTIVAHAIYLKDNEYKLLSKTQTSVAHCPSSNFFLHSGCADTAKMEKNNITIGLGTDVGGGPSFSLFSVMRDAYYVRRMPPVTAFYYATMGGAKALNMDKRIGSFDIGKEADFIVVEYPPGCPQQASTERVMAQLIFRGDDRLIREAYVRGKRIYQRTS